MQFPRRYCIGIPRGSDCIGLSPAMRAIAVTAIGRERIRRITVPPPFQRRWAKDPNGVLYQVV